MDIAFSDFYEFFRDLGLSHDLLLYMSEREKAREDAAKRISLHDHFAMRTMLAHILEQPEDLIRLKHNAGDRLQAVASGAFAPETAFHRDGYMAGELHDAMHATDAPCEDPHQFEAAAHMVVNAARPLLDERLFASGTKLWIVGRGAQLDANTVYRKLSRGHVLLTLQHIEKLRSRLPLMTEALEAGGHAGLARLSCACARRADAIFTAIVKTAEAEMAASAAQARGWFARGPQ